MTARNDGFRSDPATGNFAPPGPFPGVPNAETTPMPTMSHLQPIVALLAGIAILIVPRLLNFIVAIYLILIGIIGLGILR